jgi:cholesterol transport system auxiliary component
MTRRWAALLFPLLLAACVGAPAPKDTFYRLEVAQPAERFQRPPLPGVLEVDRLDADGVVGERALTFATHEGGPLEHYRYDLWSETPGIMLRDQLARVLSKAGAAERVVTPDLRVPADWTLRGKVRRFEQVAGAAQVAVEIQLGVVSARDGTLVMLDTYSAKVPTNGESVEAAVGGIDRAVSDIVARFVADLGRVKLPAVKP